LDESKTDFKGEVDRFKIGAGEGRKNDARKNWAMHFGSSSLLVSKWQIGTQGVDGMEEMS